MNPLRAFVFAWLFCAAPALLLAGEHPNEFTLEPGVGIQLINQHIPGLDKNIDSVYDPDVFIGAQYLRDLSPHAALGMDINFLGDSSASRRLVSNAPTAWQTKSLVVMVVFRYTVASTSFGKPYLLVGLGGHQTALQVDDNLIPIIDSTRWGLASALGAGWNIPVRDPFLVGVEGRWQSLSTTRYPLLKSAVGMTTATEGRAQPSSLDFLLRVGFRF